MIGTVLLLSLLFIVTLVCGTVLLMKLYIAQTIGKKHKELESILDTRDVPESWLRKEKGASLIHDRLEKLERYVRKTRLVDGEETRSYLLSELSSIKEEWMRRHDIEFARSE
ncbi:hypothetical protein [Paenibacillus thermotolerans]|uniref:hypothetical protein n=1 Tax=Paenibacillus thermotolerans TaxID=3027807 RepID=UPI00236878E7|nr:MULTISPECIES: hypothetical protein [unclassified Paenibacillus]